MAHRQSLARGRLVFQDETIRELVDVATGRIETMGEREAALRLCLARLPKAQRQMLSRRYNQGMSVAQIAGELSRPVGSVRQALYRIRGALQACIDRRLSQQRAG